jgi:hypothetical protein
MKGKKSPKNILTSHPHPPQASFTSVDILKLTRLVRLARFLQKMERQGKQLFLLGLIVKIFRFSQYSAVILSLLVIFFIFISHWLACVWFVIGQYQDAGDDVGKTTIFYNYIVEDSLSPLFDIFTNYFVFQAGLSSLLSCTSYQTSPSYLR